MMMICTTALMMMTSVTFEQVDPSSEENEPRKYMPNLLFN